VGAVRFVYLLALLVLATTAAGSAGAAPAVLPASVAAVPASAGAAHVALAVSFPTELRCGRLNGDAPLTIRLPAAMRLPRSVPVTAVRIGDEPAGSVAVAGHALVVKPMGQQGIMCNAITDGSIRITVKAPAGLANPATPGSYRVVVARGGETFAGTLRIRR
jgi:hypothetical protein